MEIKKASAIKIKDLPPDFDYEKFAALWREILQREMRGALIEYTGEEMQRRIYGEGKDKPVGFLKDGT